MEPPACVQNAMMTKDKKPFTYTPGGIDLSEARSPRLQRRIERNAHLQGVGDLPQNPAYNPQTTGPLPPSAMAAIRPQPQVQVFPSGPPPTTPLRGSIPPPPPPPKGIPPPPPPPNCPLPTQKVHTSDNQVLERPDMTKIIPENPMALLRRTGGPQPRKSLVDQLFEEVEKPTAECKSPPVQQFKPAQQRIQPVAAPISPVPQQAYKPHQQYNPQMPQSPVEQQQFQVPTNQNIPVRENYSEPVIEQSRYQPTVIDRQRTTPQSNGNQEVKTSTANLGSLYIPPINQQQKRIVTPPTPPERNVDSPSLQTPPLREAPRPWQTKKTQEEVPSWAKRDNQVCNNVEGKKKVSPPVSQPEARWLQAQDNEPNSQQQYELPTYNQQVTQPSYGKLDSNQQQQPIGIRINIRTKPQAPYEDQSASNNNPNVVYVTQPLVLQHPGPNPQKQPNNLGPKNQGGVRVMAADGRVLNRQQSWGNNPSQSNSFKALQKFTNTDEDDDFVNAPVTQHSPKYTQNCQPPVEQTRRMKINEGDQHITNTFKQVAGSPQMPQAKGTQVRNIPIQIEGDGPPRPYVHPSEQVVPEPKKYTGSSIPSRSFRILQAMTAPNDYANVEEQNEDMPHDEWVYPPYYPPYPYAPFWYDFYRYYYPDSNPEDTKANKKSTRNGASRSNSPATSGLHTPIPFWGYAPPYYPPSTSSDNGNDTPNSKPPVWYGYDQYYSLEQESDTIDENTTPEYFPYYDPYYYHYYYGYPPIFPLFPAGYSNSETNSTINSLDEKKSDSEALPEHQVKTQQNSEKSILTPTICINETITFKKGTENVNESLTDCETDTETDNEYDNRLKSNPLQAMKSITNMNILNTDSSDEETSKEDVQAEEWSEDSNEDNTSSMCYEEDAYPHQLSVIMEESERTESRLRTVSSLSDSTTLAGKSDVEDVIEEDDDATEPKSNDQSNNIENLEKSIPDIEASEEKDADEINDDNCSDESEDWWGIIGKDDDDLPKPRKTFTYNYNDDNFDNDNTISDPNTIIEADSTSEKEPEPINTAVEECETIISKANEELSDDTDIQVSNCEESNNMVGTESVVFRRTKPESSDTDVKPRPRSIYDSLENIKTESTGNLVKVDNFVGLLEQMQKESGFWNLTDKDDSQTVIKFRRTKSVEEKSNEYVGKRFTWTSFDNFNKETYSEDNEIDNTTKRLSCGALDNPTEMVNSSTNYIMYNRSVSSTPSFDQNSRGYTKPFIEHLQTTESTDTTNSLEKDEKEDCNLLQLKIPTIKDRIQALRDSINAKRKQLEEAKSPSKEMFTSNKSKTTSSKSSVKSSEEYSEDEEEGDDEEEEEEEVDSGVTSDMSRHISDTEEFLELRKLTKYQRAATHSRLFKLLQEECNSEEADESSQKQNLSLHLNETTTHNEINEKLVNELIDSLLRLKKGQAFKNLPKEKLYAAAVKILQEDMDITETAMEESNSLLSPVKSSTGYSTAVHTPQEFRNSFEDYKQYYESWDRDEENYEIFPSKTFKALQEISSLNKQGGGLGSFAKCPKVLSSKNIHKKLIRLLESSENSSYPNPDDPPLDTNEVTSAS
ncbi:uncharacterized protein LOC130892559 [Diorhabda carinulata]|uniref:uncharacterized protein LOC130892559 n=1 Tax=Diorhabda carinulata TaxID=1163345 RepID=UPI0025A16033|nr:uncharacterized protein LOC130892559 [Diorhabda carinulata]XP_057654006.1 uncharacterized protein LOC130892559 [Diorhabda carinulata]